MTIAFIILIVSLALLTLPLAFAAALAAYLVVRDLLDEVKDR